VTADDAVDLTPGPYYCLDCGRDFDSHLAYNTHAPCHGDGGAWFFGGARLSDTCWCGRLNIQPPNCLTVRGLTRSCGWWNCHPPKGTGRRR
jgi:hypothetical protein